MTKEKIGLACLAMAMAMALAVSGPAAAQTKLKWAHVYETNEPYHTEALWAASEIAKRTNNKYQIEVFPASQLGNENQINEALTLGTVDMIYTGVAFAGSIHKPLAITNAPFILRDFDHWKAYRDSRLFRDIASGYEQKTGHKVMSLTYYGQRHVTANKEIKVPEDMKGMKLRVPPAPLFMMFTKSVGANATPIAFAEVYLALQQKTVDGQENPLPIILNSKLYEVQNHLTIWNYMYDPIVFGMNKKLYDSLDPETQQLFKETAQEAAKYQIELNRKQDAEVLAKLKEHGMQVTELTPEQIKAFQEMAKPVIEKYEGIVGKELIDAFRN